MKKPLSHSSRREFLRQAGLAGLAGATLSAAPSARAASKAKGASAGKARNLIFLVADGMNNGTLAAAHHYLNLTAQRDTEWMRLYRDGLSRRGLVETSSATGIVTDSAAAATAWGGGQRVLNGSLNMTSEGKALTPLYHYGKQAGKALGLVSTTRLTHATPAGFAVSVPSRDLEDEIAEQFLARGEVDILFGGGSRHFDPAQRDDGRDLFAAYAKAGFNVLRSRADLARAPREGRFLGTFCDTHLPYQIDRTHDAALGDTVPALDVMMQAALERLAGRSEGFLLQVEGGRIDHAGHANDAGAILHDMLEFDRCIGVARRFAERHGDTLVIVTTDHGTGGFMINGAGPRYAFSSDRFRHLGAVSASYEHLQRRGASPLQTVKALGLGAEEGLARRALDALQGMGNDRNAMSDALQPILADWLSVSWNSHNHTADLAEFASFGPGSETIPDYHENWELHHRLREILAI
ncbi:MAG: alkaline phosphatase [Opitutales bacterium]